MSERPALLDRISIRAIFIAASSAVALACGGGSDAPAPSGPSMGGGASATANAADGSLPPDNRAPRIVSASFVPPRPAAGQQVRAEIEATDPDGDPVRFTYQWNLRGRDLPGETANHTVLRDARKGDLVVLRVRATDGLSMIDHELKVRVGNRPPDVDGIVFEPPGELIAGRQLHARALAKDPDGDRLESDFEWIVNGRRRGRGAGFSTEGLRRGDRLRVIARVSDGDPEEAVEFTTPDFELGNAAPVVSFEAFPPNPDGGLVYRLPATDPDGDPLRFRLREAPEGMTIVATRGEIEWTPRNDQIGEFRVVVEVDDLHGGVTEQAFTMRVGDGAPASP